MKFVAKVEQDIYEVTVETLPEVDSVPHLGITLRKGGLEKHYEIKLLGKHKDRLTLELDHTVEDFVVSKTDDGTFVDWRSQVFPLEIYGLRERIVRKSRREDVQGEVELRAQMPGKIIKLMKSVGEPVEAGEGTIVVEAMKMQNEIRSPKKGTVVSCDLREGDSVKAGDLLLRIE